MVATTLALTVQAPDLCASSRWSQWEAGAVELGKYAPSVALAAALTDAQDELIARCCGPAWKPVRALAAPFACPRCGAREDFARHGMRNRARKLTTSVGVVEIILAQVRCRGCGKVFAPLLLVLGLWGKRRTDRLAVDLADLSTQMSFARAARITGQLSGAQPSASAAHHALADVAGMLTGGPGADGRPGVLGPGHHNPDVVMLDGTGVRAGKGKNGVGANIAIGISARTGPKQRRRARSDLLALSVGQDWSMLGPQLAAVAAPKLVLVDGEASITALAQRLWPSAPVQRCWWHLPHGLRKALYADDAANRHNNPRWARTKTTELADLLRAQGAHEHTPERALQAWDTFTASIPAVLASAHAYLNAARPHAFTALDPALRARLAHLGGPDLGTGVIERLMREINARTDIGGARWSITGMRDLLTVTTARLLAHPAWKEITKATRPPATLTFTLQNFNAA